MTLMILKSWKIFIKTSAHFKITRMAHMIHEYSAGKRFVSVFTPQTVSAMAVITVLYETLMSRTFKEE